MRRWLAAVRELTLHILDIVQNSIAAGASTAEIALEENTAEQTLCIAIKDNGRGMSQEECIRAMDPFFTTRSGREVGLGIPLFQMAAQMTGGDLTICARPEGGTELRARFFTQQTDMPPLGKLEDGILLLIVAAPEVDFVYTRTLDQKSFTLDTRAVKKALGAQVPIFHPEVIGWMRKFLESAVYT